MSLPESEIVKVTVNASQQATSKKGFGLTCLFGHSTILPSGQRYGLYDSLVDVGKVFPANSSEYLAAAVVFSNPNVSQLMIARMFNAAVAAELLGGAPTTVVATYAAIANGALSIVVDGTPEVISAINLTGVTTLPGVAAAVQTALQIAKPNATVTYDGARFIVRSGTTGIASTLAFATVAPAGTDLAPLLALRAADNGTLTQGLAVETVTQSLQNVLALSSDWYMLSLVYSPSDQDIEDAGAFALTNQLVFGYTTSEGNVVVQGNTTDIASVLQATTNKRVIGMFDLTGNNPFGILGALAEASTVDFTGADTAETLMFKQLPGVAVSNLTPTQKSTCDGKNINYYVSIGGNPMFATGVMADGSWFDQVQGLDWLSSAVQSAVFEGLYGSKKVDQTDKGMATLLHLLEVPLQQAVANGLLAPGVWNGAGVGQIKTGDRLPKGYYSFAASVDSQTQTVRNTRVGPPITIIAKGAGALQGINIVLNFEE